MKFLIKCPYCNSPLKKEPKRMSKCLHCKQPMYPRVTVNNVTALVTKKEKDKIDHDKWEEQNRKGIEESKRKWEDFFINRYKGYLENWFNVDDKEYEKIKKDLEKEFKDKGFESPSGKDVIWRALHVCLQKAIKENDWDNMSEVYLLQARILIEEGKDPSVCVTTYYQCSLEKIRSEGFENIFFLSNYGICHNCKKYVKDEVKMTVDDALNEIKGIVERCKNKKFTNDSCLTIMPIPDLEK